MESTSQARPRGSKTVHLLLDTLEQLMIEKGITNIPILDIVERSGLNQGLVKYHFGNKAGMELALLRRAMRPAMEQLEHLDEMDATPSQKLRIHISGMVNTYFKYPYVNRLMHRMMAENPDEFGPIIISEFSQKAAIAQKKILDEGVADGSFRRVDHLSFYFHIVGACDQIFAGRYQLEGIFGRKCIDDDLRRTYIDHLCGIVIRGIEPKSDTDPLPFAIGSSRRDIEQ